MVCVKTCFSFFGLEHNFKEFKAHQQEEIKSETGHKTVAMEPVINKIVEIVRRNIDLESDGSFRVPMMVHRHGQDCHSSSVDRPTDRAQESHSTTPRRGSRLPQTPKIRAL